MPVVDHVSSMVASAIGSRPAIISGRPSIHDFSPSRWTHAPAISQSAWWLPDTLVARPLKR